MDRTSAHRDADMRGDGSSGIELLWNKLEIW